MAKTLQNFYKSTLSGDWSIGTGTFYVTTKPTITDGWLVISPNNSNLREIVRYTGTGTDANGDYITVSIRGVGGTSEQTHTTGEPIRMNITAEYWNEMNTDIANIVAAGVPNANTTTMGGVEEATAAEIDSLSQTGSTGAELFINPKLLGDAHNIPHVAPGTSGNTLVSNGTDWISQELKIPTFFQINAYGTREYDARFASTQDGSCLLGCGSTGYAYSIPKNSTGTYPVEKYTYTVTSQSGYNRSVGSILNIGNYSYLIISQSQYGGSFPGTYEVVRVDKLTLANPTTMTASGNAFSGNKAIQNPQAFTDGTYIYLNVGTTSWEKWSISGTNLTYVSALTGFNIATTVGLAGDYTNVYVVTESAGVYTLNKYNSTGETLIESIVINNASSSFTSSNSSTTYKGIATATTGIVYVIYYVDYSTKDTDDTGVSYYFIPIATS